MDSSERELRWLRRIRDLCQRLAAEPDLEELLPKILDAAIEITEAERGFLVRTRPLDDGDHAIRVAVARGFDRRDLDGPEGEVSRTVVERVLKRGGEGLVTTSQLDQGVLEVSSVKDREVLSILCVPLRLRGETKGVLYLDHRFITGAFSAEDLPVLSGFADQAAVALETAELTGLRADSPGPLQKSLQELWALEESPPPIAPSDRRYGRLIGASPPMLALYGEIERAARSAGPGLLLGEEGVGKRLVANEIHDRSDRASQPFVVVSCRGETAESLESILFGHRAGVAPWATSDYAGQLALTGSGTVVLEEISALPRHLQERLVHALRERAARAAGGMQPQPIDCRILATTTQDLRSNVDAGTFSAGLYYQLDVLRLIVPPLRQRTEDIPALCEQFRLELKGRSMQFSERTLKLMLSYSWPGNLVELRNQVQRLLTQDKYRIAARDLAPEVREGRGVAQSGASYGGKTLGEVEREMIESALRDCVGNKTRAARQLGVPRTTLYHLMERYGLGS